MKIRSSRHRHFAVCRCVFALLALGVLPVAARGADAVKMEIMSPLALTEKPLAMQVRFGRWFPIAVTLSNTGDAVQGTLTLRLTSSGSEARPSSQFFTQVDLPANQANKRVWLYGRLEGEEYDGAEVQFQGRGIKTLREVCYLKTPDVGTRIVLTISDTDEKLSYLAGLKGPGLGLADAIKKDNDALYNGSMPGMPSNSAAPPAAGAMLVRPLGTTHEWVPDRWIGFDAVDALVLHDFPHAALAADQLTALRGYVAGGGSLLILGGANGQRLAQSPLAALWPVTPGGSSVATPQEVNSLVRRYVTVTTLSGADRLGGAPVLMGRSALRQGAQRLAGTTASPLLATSDVGAGKVLFLAVDPTRPPFLGWSGNAGLWADIFKQATPPQRLESVTTDFMDGNAYGNMGGYRNQYGGVNDPNATGATGQLWRVLTAARQLRTPPVSYIVWFLALYVFFLVPVNYCVLRYFDRRELAWITIPIIVIAFSVMSYAAALSIKGNAILLRHVTIVQGAADSGAARADAMLWLFSPRKTTYNISSRDPQMVVGDYAVGESGVYPGLSLREPNVGKAFLAEDAPLNMWSSRVFVGHAVTNLGRGVRVWSKGAAPSVQNNTGQNLRGVVVVTGGVVRGYGDMADGATVSAPRQTDDINNIDPNLVSRIHRAANLEKIFPAAGEENLNAIAQQTLGVALGSSFDKVNSGNWLIAWSDQPAATKDHPATTLTIGAAAPQARYITLFLMRLPNSAELAALPAPGAVKLGNAEQTREATVRLTGFETPDAAKKIAGLTMTYDCTLPATSQAAPGWRELSITAVGNRWSDPNDYRYGYRGSPPPGAPGAPPPVIIAPPPNKRTATKKPASPVQLQIWNFARRQWQSVPGTATSEANMGAWSYRAAITGSQATECVQQPDNLVRLRLRTAQAANRVTSLRLTAAQAGANASR